MWRGEAQVSGGKGQESKLSSKEQRANGPTG